jgi:2'-5' RNA ligase
MRLFVGIRIEPNEKIGKALAEAKKLGLRMVAEDNLHINLKFLGEVDEGQTEGIKNALDSAQGFGSFEVELTGIGAFPNANFIRVVWIGVKSDKVIALAKLIDGELARVGFNKETSYTPHVTLARVVRKTEGVKAMLSEEDFGTQRVEEVHLMKSELSPKGPRYDKIHSVRL